MTFSVPSHCCDRKCKTLSPSTRKPMLLKSLYIPVLAMAIHIITSCPKRPQVPSSHNDVSPNSNDFGWNNNQLPRALLALSSSPFHHQPSTQSPLLPPHPWNQLLITACDMSSNEGAKSVVKDLHWQQIQWMSWNSENFLKQIASDFAPNCKVGLLLAQNLRFWLNHITK